MTDGYARVEPLSQQDVIDLPRTHEVCHQSRRHRRLAPPIADTVAPGPRAVVIRLDPVQIAGRVIVRG